MYQVGEFIVYSTSGVCQVTAVGQPDFAEGSRRYYTLRPIQGTEIIYVPVDSSEFMRPVITRAQAEALVAAIPSVEAEDTAGQSQRVTGEHYQAALQSHDCRALVQLIKTVYAKAHTAGRRVSQIDQRYRKRAEELLHGELAVALGIPLGEVQPYITRTIAAQRARP